MTFKWVGPLALLGLLVAGDQIRINRPGHKYRLTVEVETPEGVKSAAGIMAVHPDRGYSRRGRTTTKGDAVLVDLGGGKNLFVLLAHLDTTLDLEGMNYVALRAYRATGLNVSFNDLSRITGTVAVTGSLIPVLISFADLKDPKSARVVGADNLEATLGQGFRLHGLTAEIVPNGLWPLDFGGMLGEPVTRGIESKLPWWNRANAPAAALDATGLPRDEPFDAREVFTRK
jgi:hypothetical protein